MLTTNNTIEKVFHGHVEVSYKSVSTTIPSEPRHFAEYVDHEMAMVDLWIEEAARASYEEEFFSSFMFEKLMEVKEP